MACAKARVSKSDELTAVINKELDRAHKKQLSKSEKGIAQWHKVDQSRLPVPVESDGMVVADM